MYDAMLRNIARIHDITTEAFTWFAFTLSGVRYGPSHLEQLKKRRELERRDNSERS